MTYSMRRGIGDVPQGFIEVRDPPLWTYRGAEQARVAPPRTLFIRAQLVPFMGAGFRQQPDPPPRWVLYGGPLTEQEVPHAMKALKSWAFWQRSQDGSVQGYDVLSEIAVIAPDGFKTRWPRRQFAWTWEHETADPRRFRWEQDPGPSGTPGRWVQV